MQVNTGWCGWTRSSTTLRSISKLCCGTRRALWHSAPSALTWASCPLLLWGSRTSASRWTATWKSHRSASQLRSFTSESTRRWVSVQQVFHASVSVCLSVIYVSFISIHVCLCLKACIFYVYLSIVYLSIYVYIPSISIYLYIYMSVFCIYLIHLFTYLSAYPYAAAAAIVSQPQQILSLLTALPSGCYMCGS